jgi:hypothetical protein
VKYTGERIAIFVLALIAAVPGGTIAGMVVSGMVFAAPASIVAGAFDLDFHADEYMDAVAFCVGCPAIVVGWIAAIGSFVTGGSWYAPGDA